jgi:hypothetical protein
MGRTVVDGSTIDGCLTPYDPPKETDMNSMASNFQNRHCVSSSV